MTALVHEVFLDADAAAQRAAMFVAEKARIAIAERGRFVVAFSGGTTPGTMLRRLAGMDVDWRRTFVTQVDERITPTSDGDRNMTRLRTDLLDNVPIPAPQVLPMPVEVDDPAEAARAYARRLIEISGNPPVLDLVHLGLGDDGHVASLFPGDPLVEITSADVGISGCHRGWPRMTLTLPTLNRARSILWLVTGAEKSAVAARLLRGDEDMPAGRIARPQALLVLAR